MKNTQTNTQGVKQVALSNSTKTRERERESNSALNISSSKSSNYRTYKATSVITDNDSTSVIIGKDSTSVIADKGYTSVIASKLDSLESKLRGTSPQLRSSDSACKREWAQLCKQNLFFTHCGVDCHENPSGFSRNDDNVNSFNDGNFFYAKNPCHTEGF